MPPDILDFSRRAQLSELMDEPCSRDVLRHCLRDLARVNRWFLAYRPTLMWLNTVAPPKNRPMHILDVGCGYGDTLRRVERWSEERSIPVALTGCDLNPDTIAVAREASPARSHIRRNTTEEKAQESNKPEDNNDSTQNTHHLSEVEIIRFLEWM